MQKLTIIGEQEEELKCDESDGGINAQDEAMPEGHKDKSPTDDKTVSVTQQQMRETTSSKFEEKHKSASHINQKRHKSKQIKKILKERLNIDCLRMLCPDEEDL